MKYRFYSRTLPLLFIIFLVSVLVRLPNLDRPLSKHHEFCTAIALRIMQVWSEEGIDKFGYNPAMNYNNEADKYINNHANTTRKVIDGEGNFYYVSHPPFAYYLPYYSFSLLGVQPSVKSLQLFNMVLHLVSGFFVYLIVSLLAVTKARSEISIPAVIAYIIYMFSPPTLWFLSNVYMADMLVHVIFVVGIYTTLKMIIRQRFSSFKYLFNFFLVIFLMVYTSWLGVFYAISFILYGLFRAEKNTGFTIPVTLAFLAMISAVGLTIYQYSTINGIDAYLAEAMSRFQLRGSFGGGGSGIKGILLLKLSEFKTLIFNYLANYLPIFILLGLFSFSMISKAKLKIVFSENGYRFLYLAVWPIIWLHIFLLNYSGQDFTTLYASVFFATVVGILYDKLLVSGAVTKIYLNVSLAATIVLMIGIYYYVNRPGTVSWKGDVYALNQQAGNLVKQTAENNQVVFILGKEAFPQMLVYAERNIQQINNREEALLFLNSRNLSKGIIFQRDEAGKFQVAEEINLEVKP